MSQIFTSKKQNNEAAEIAFLDALSEAISPQTHVVIITDAGFQSAWFRHVRSLGWDFIGRVRGIVKFRLHSDKESWLNIKMCKGSTQEKYLGTGTLARSKHSQCDGHFYLYKKESAGRKSKRPEESPAHPKRKRNKKHRRGSPG